MPKFECKCGTVLGLGDAPAAEEHLLVPEAVLYSVLGSRKTPDELVELLDSVGRAALVCGSCQRLWLQEASGGLQYIEYRRVLPAGEVEPAQ